MRLPASRSILLLLVSGSMLAAPSLPQLFHKAKEQFRLGGYANALETLSTIEAEVEKPENQSQRAGLRPGLAFYRGACLAERRQRYRAAQGS